MWMPGDARDGRAELRGDEGAPVAALRGEAAVAEHVGHERGERVGDPAMLNRG